MKTDRELLEAAAKAAGMLVFKEGERWDDDAKGWFFNQVGDNPPALYGTERPSSWMPLTDDGDALRLAVKLNLTCRFYFGNTCAQATAPGMPSAYEDVQNSADPMAGARLAIVRAAAAMAG